MLTLEVGTLFALHALPHRSNSHLFLLSDLFNSFSQASFCCSSSDAFIFYFVAPQTVEKVLLAYADRVKADSSQFQRDHKTAIILINNIQQMRVQLEKLYEAMDRNRQVDGSSWGSGSQSYRQWDRLLTMHVAERVKRSLSCHEVKLFV
ncbi:unnamed protein product [Protopolystoma xenopodis]|uniref:MUN domain-containing protein n=1 Tax=Protopolystoma xenopodis TaxID=117903 RepID=A0A3S5FFV5_9PLAT|nr:unnamed protein product [Protopolystoma xenopodis]